jgi:hypothetical protein
VVVVALVSRDQDCLVLGAPLHLHASKYSVMTHS